MKTLIDNTLLHSIGAVVGSRRSPSVAREIGGQMAIFHFAEHLLFADEMEYISFSLPEIREISANVTDQLYKRGYTVGEHGESILQMIEYSNEEYASACEAAAPMIIADLESPEIIPTLKKAGRLTIDTDAIGKWLTKDSSEEDREGLKENSLSQKATGAFDYTVSIDDVLFRKLQEVGSEVKGNRTDKANAARGISILFRTAINQALALQRNAYYSPAPQRAGIIYESDRLFRHALSKTIQKVVAPIRELHSRKILEKLQEDEKIPLPMLAIHFLRKAKVRHPEGLLEAARKMRDDPEVKSIRRWLNKWEDAYGSEKARNYLDEISKDLKVEVQKEHHPIFSVMRVVISPTPEGGIEIKPDFSKVAEEIYLLLRRFRRRKIFLATLTKEFAFDRKLDGDVISMLGRALTS
jgi:hypothetical protein